MTKPNTIHLIVNPYGGKGKSLKIANFAKSDLEKSDIKVELHQTQYFGHSESIISDLSLDENTAVCGVGGDGTVHHIINGLLNRADKKVVPLAIIPAGTGNDLAYDLMLSDAKSAIECIKSGKTRLLDIGYVEGQKKSSYMAVVTTWGYATKLTMTAEKIRWFGLTRYTVAGLFELIRHKGHQAKVILDGGEVIEDYFDLFMILNPRYSGKRVMTAPQAKIDDGLLDLVMLRNKGKFGLYKTLMDIQNNRIEKNTIIEYRQFKKLTLEPVSDFDINLDGESYGKAPCTISVLPQKLIVYG
jgi:YegS/Rv2252/BmrU family lipid kinase